MKPKAVTKYGKLRQRQKRQLKRFGDIIDVTLSIGYTD